MNDTSGLTVDPRETWITTASGRRFYPFRPHPDDVFLEDIAAHLSRICRFGGACREFYSVAQHSFHVSCLLEGPDAAWGLLHDAAEAFIGDMVAPVKAHFGRFAMMEGAIMRAITDRFGLAPFQPEAVTLADRQMLVTESALLMPRPITWPGAPEPDRDRLDVLAPDEARESYLIRARHVGLS